MEPIDPRDCDSPYPPSETVLHVPVFCHCLYIMMMLAQRLPVALIPEEFHVSTMWNDMIHDCSLGNLPLCITSHANGIRLQELLPCLLPFVTVSTLTRIFTISHVHRLMLIAVLLSIWNQPCTHWMFAGYVRSSRHMIISQYKSPEGSLPQGSVLFYYRHYNYIIGTISHSITSTLNFIIFGKFS